MGWGSPGCVELVSGAGGHVLRRWWGGYDGSQFGWSVAQLGDLDGDGAPELGFAARQRQDSGYAVVVSSRTDRTLYKLDGRAKDDRFGSCIARCGDVDFDGIDEFVVGASRSCGYQDERGRGYVCIHSGADGRLIRRIDGTDEGSAFGAEACGLGDVDGDGSADVAIGAPLDSFLDEARSEDGSAPYCGAVFIHSGLYGKLLGRLRGQEGWDQLGCALLPVPRAGGSAACDLLVGVPGRGEVWLISTEDFRVVKTIRAERGFGRALADLGDIDGDGTSDYAVAAFQYGVSQEAAVYLVPGKALAP
jgi:hypothetical protein